MGSRSSVIRAGRAAPHRRGVPVALPPVGAIAPGTRQLPLLGDEPDRRTAAELLPGVVLVPRFLDHDDQRALVAEFRRWAEPPAGLRHPRVPTGHRMTVQSVCLGWHWYPYVYSRTADDTDGAPVKPMTDGVIDLAQRAVAAAYDDAAGATHRPDAVIANLYPPGAHLGLHQDGEEPADAPVVTISIGDTCVFRMAGVDRRTGPFTDVELRSGDLLVFGRASRRIFHGVPKVLDGTGPEDLGLPPGRLSLTVRETGLVD
jgi:alkylated DNA repair protein (DNA oxidative demethylase)